MSIDFWDVAAIIGAILIVAGVTLIYLPAAFIVAGSFLVLLALYGSRGTSS